MVHTGGLLEDLGMRLVCIRLHDYTEILYGHILQDQGSSSKTSLVPRPARLPVRNGLMNKVKFLGLITQNG